MQHSGGERRGWEGKEGAKHAFVRVPPIYTGEPSVHCCG